MPLSPCDRVVLRSASTGRGCWCKHQKGPARNATGGAVDSRASPLAPG